MLTRGENVIEWKLDSLLPDILKLFGTHMSSREAAKMGDILANEADLLGMIKEVGRFFCKLPYANRSEH